MPVLDSACYKIMQAHLGLHQRRGHRRPVPVKPEPGADAKRAARPKAGGRKEITHAHTQTHARSQSGRASYFEVRTQRTKYRIKTRPKEFNFQAVRGDICEPSVWPLHILQHRLYASRALIHKHSSVGDDRCFYPLKIPKLQKSLHFSPLSCCYGYMAWLHV